jgi:hypothetical protein
MAPDTILVCLSPKLEDVLTAKIMEMLREQIPKSFGVADTGLRRRDNAFRQAQGSL